MTVTTTRGTPAGAGGAGGGGGEPPLEPYTPERKKAVKRYFARTPPGADELRAERTLWAALAAGVLAGALAAVGSFALAAIVGAGAVVLAVNGWMQLAEYRRRYDKAEPKPRPTTMDGTLKRDLRRIADHAMSRFGLTPADLVLHSSEARRWEGAPSFADQGRGPLVVFGPARKATGRCDVDRVWRFTAYDVLVACPTEHHLAIHLCTLDFASGKRRDEHTHEYHYAHVVAILMNSRRSTDFGIDLMDSPLRARSAEQLVLREFHVAVASNDRSGIVVGVSDQDRPDHRIQLQDSNIDNVVAALRHTLRERGGGAADQYPT